MSLLGPSRLPTSTVIKGSVDASLSANLPASPAIGDTWIVSVAGDFQNDALVSPANYDLTIGDMILWDGTNWLVRESGDDSMKTTLNLSDVADAPTARTNLDVYSTDQVDYHLDSIATHNLANLTPTNASHNVTYFHDFATAATVTLPDSLDDAVTFSVVNKIDKVITWGVSGSATIESLNGTSQADQHGVVTAIHRTGGVWTLIGNLA